jgi:D-amino peptidase
MRIFISVDMEGISGVEKVEEVFRGMPAYETFRQIMAGDVNAAVQGAIDGGATDIVVADSHGYMCNIRPKDVHRQARLRSGMKRVLCQFKSFSHRFDAAFFVGYHSKAGTADGILSHTWIPAFQDVRVNGLSVGEYGLNGLLMGSFDVPPILLCGDDKTVEQARPVLGDIEYVSVKKSLGYFEGEHLPLAESHARIREAAKRAVERFAHNRPPSPRADLPVTFELDLARWDNPLVTRMEEENLRFVDDDTDLSLSDIELIAEYEPVEIRGPQTVSFTFNRYFEAYNMLFRILSYFYERDIEWLLEEVASPDAYRRDLNILVAGSSLNYLGREETGVPDR